MKKLILSTALVLSVLAVRAQGFEGKWNGRMGDETRSMRMVFDIKKTNGMWSGSAQSPDQSGQWYPATNIAVHGDSLRMEFAPIGAFYKGVLADGQIRGEFTQGVTLKLDLNRGDIVNIRPQEPKPPYPYSVEDVTFKSGDIELAGTLTTPRKAPMAVVVLVSGSGPQNRDEELFGHRPFAVIADHLTRHGIAALRYDDRGWGKSAGIYATASVEDFTADAMAGIEYARERFPQAPVGVVGHSLGGAIAIMATSQGTTDFIVSLAGIGIDGKALIRQQKSDQLRAAGAPEEFITPYMATLNRAVDAALALESPADIRAAVTPVVAGTPIEREIDVLIQQMASPELRSTILFKPADYFPRVKCPVLALNGEKDLQVACESNLAGFRAGVPHVVTKSFPGLNHLFQHAETGSTTEYGQIEETFSPDALNEISQWILALPRKR